MGIMNKMATVDLSTLTWTKSGDEFLSIGLMNIAKKPSSSNIKANIFCEIYAVVAGNDRVGLDNVIAFTAGGYLYIRDSSVTTWQELTAKLQGVLLTYETSDSVEEEIINSMKTVDLGSLVINNIGSQSGGYRYTFRIEDIGTNYNLFCSEFVVNKQHTASNITIGEMYAIPSSHLLYVVIAENLNPLQMASRMQGVILTYQSNTDQTEEIM